MTQKAAPTSLPTHLAVSLRPALPGLAQDTVRAIGLEVPAYARPLEGPFGNALSEGVQRALEQFVDAIAAGEVTGAVDRHRGSDVYVELGRGEQRAGRSLDALLSAYRLGARLAWERFVSAAEAAGEDPRTLYALAGAIFSYIDAISAASVDGFTQEQSRTASERARRRRALVRALAGGEASADDLAGLAHVAGWTVPATVAALLVAGDHDAERLASRLGVDVLAAPDAERVLAFVPDPEAPGRRAQIGAALPEGAGAALGPAMAPALAHRSFARAQALLSLVEQGVVEAAMPAVADEHLMALVLHGADPSLAADLATRVLAPLEGLTPGARERLLGTLRVWLEQPGAVKPAAERLGVHPQTVRYRVARLYERFGETLDDPERRFEIALALRLCG